MRGMFISVLHHKDNKSFSVNRELKSKDDFVNKIVLDYGNS